MSEPTERSPLVVIDPQGGLASLSTYPMRLPTRLPSSSGYELGLGTSLVVVGPRAQVAPECVAAFRREAPGVFVAWASERGDAGDLSEGLRLADATFVVPDDLVLLRELVQSHLTPARVNGRSAAITGVAGNLAAAALFFIMWALLVRAFRIPDYLAPSPEAVLREASRAPIEYGYHLFVTAAEAAVGFGVGNLIGLLSGILLFRVDWLRRLAMPAVVGLQSVPIVAFAPLLVVWFGSGWMSKVLMASIICYFPMTANTLAAFGGVDPDLQDYFRLHRATFLRTVRHLLLPASAPALLAALRISAGLAVVGAIVAEMTGADRGLGYLLLTASWRLETERLFVSILLAALLGVTFYAAPGLLKVSRTFRRLLQ